MLEARRPDDFVITEDSLPKTVEQKTLLVLERIEKLLIEILDDDTSPVLNADGTKMDLSDVVKNIEPTATPFIKQMGPHGKPSKVKKF